MLRPLELEEWDLQRWWGLLGERGPAEATRDLAILIFTLTHSVVISNNVLDIARKARRERELARAAQAGGGGLQRG
jgi:hypothetical protein